MLNIIIDEGQHTICAGSDEELREYLFDLPTGKIVTTINFTDLKVELFENSLIINYCNKPEAIVYHLHKPFVTGIRNLELE